MQMYVILAWTRTFLPKRLRNRLKTFKSLVINLGISLLEVHFLDLKILDFRSVLVGRITKGKIYFHDAAVSQ